VPMTVDGLKDKIYSEMEAVYWPDTPMSADAEAKLKEYYGVIAKAVVEYVQDNADVLPGSFTSPAGSVTGKGKLE